MTRVKPGQRQRARAPKVRTGCVTCKIRKVKCDENRPACIRCTSTGRKCDGYAPTPDSLTHGSNLGHLRPRVGDVRELRSLQFFIERTVAQFSAFFHDELWSTCLLQYAYSEDCVWHALVSLSAFHERYLRLYDVDEALFAIHEHNLAIRETTRGHSLSRDVHLVTCVIFICIEVLQGRSESAIRLFKSGRRLIQGFTRGTNSSQSSGTTYVSECNQVNHLLEPFFVRLAVQVSLLAGDLDPELTIDAIHRLNLPDPALEHPFKSLAEAREAIFDVVVDYLSESPATPTKRRTITQRLERWAGAFERLANPPHNLPLDDSQRKGTALLELHKRYLDLDLLTLDPNHPRGPLIWDDHVGVFNEMLEFAAFAVHPETQPEQALHPQFHMDLGVLPILFSIVMRCRDPLVRRTAISLMESCPMQEGVWNSISTAKVARKVVEMEENGQAVKSCKDIAVEARIQHVDVHMVPGKKSATVQFRFRSKSWQGVIDW